MRYASLKAGGYGSGVVREQGAAQPAHETSALERRRRQNVFTFRALSGRFDAAWQVMTGRCERQPERRLTAEIPHLTNKTRRSKQDFYKNRSAPAVPQLRRLAAPALKSLQRSSDVSSLSPFSSLVSALDARVTLKATGISYLVAMCNP